MTIGYIGRRCALCLVIIWLAVTANFLLLRLATPEVSRPRGQAARQLGLDQPLPSQYLTYLSDLVHLDLKQSSSTYPLRVADQIGAALPWTIALLGTASVLSWIIGTLLGALLGWSLASRLIRVALPPLMLLSAAPYFIIALLLLYLLAFRARLFPLGGGYTEGTFPALSPAFVLDLLHHAMLPALSIVVASIGTWGLSMRGLMVSLHGEDFVLFAQAKGLRWRTIFVRYAVRNALLPQMTGLGLALGQIVSGGLLVEAVFRYPGLGGLLLHAIVTQDYQLEQGIVLIVILSIALVTLVLDLTYPLLDPRVGSSTTK